MAAQKSGVTHTPAWRIDYSPLANEISASPWFWKVNCCLIYVDELMWWTHVGLMLNSCPVCNIQLHSTIQTSTCCHSCFMSSRFCQMQTSTTRADMGQKKELMSFVDRLVPVFSCGSVTFTEGLTELLVQPLSASIPLPASLPIPPLIATLPCLHGVIVS